MADLPGELGYTSSLSASISAAGNGDNVLITCPAGSQIRVFQMFIVFNGDVNISFKSGDTTELTGTMNMLSNGNITLDYSGFPWFVTDRDEDFILNLSGAVQASGRIYYLTT